MLENDGQPPLTGAAENGHNGVAKPVLGREDVNPDRPDDIGKTPLSLIFDFLFPCALD